MSRFLLSFFWVLTLVPVFAETPWVPVTTDAGQETAAVALLESRGIPALSWSNAVVEVSAFEGLTNVPLFRLEQRLTPQDPRWDPWLLEMTEKFRPMNGFVRIWVPAEKASEAAQLVGHPGMASLPGEKTSVSAPLVTGWTLVSLALLYAGLRIVSGLRFGWPSWREPRRWLWVPLCALFLAGGGVLTIRRTGETSTTSVVSAASWVQHRWFQETWPWGSRWDDYHPGTVWTFPSYEHRNGRLTEVSTTLTAGSKVWRSTLAGTLDPRHAVRIFGTWLP